MTSCHPKTFTTAFALALVCLLGRPAQAADADRKADAHLVRGQKLFSEHKYPEAIEELRAGYVLAPQPRFLFSLGQAYRLNHQCVEAVRAYRDFVSSDPPRAQAEVAAQNIQRCADEDPSSVVVADPTPSPATARPAPGPTTPEPAVARVDNALVSPAPAPRQPVYKKWWLWTTVGVVVVGAGLGVGLGLGLRSASSFKVTLPEVGPGAMMALTR